MDYPGLGLLVALTLLFAFLAYRAFRAQRRWMKLTGGILIGPNMPVKYLEKMSDDDFRALYAYLESLGSLPDNQ